MTLAEVKDNPKQKLDAWLIPQRLYNPENVKESLDSRLELEAAGFKIIREVTLREGGFYRVRPPEGWTREPDEDRTSTNICDETGAVRMDCYFREYDGKHHKLITINSYVEIIKRPERI